MATHNKIACETCGWHGSSEDLLIGANPFDGSGINGCPNCKEIMCFGATAFLACDDPFCWQQATCGIPTAGGYRRVCSKHYKELEGQDATE